MSETWLPSPGFPNREFDSESRKRSCSGAQRGLGPLEMPCGGEGPAAGARRRRRTPRDRPGRRERRAEHAGRNHLSSLGQVRRYGSPRRRCLPGLAAKTDPGTDGTWLRNRRSPRPSRQRRPEQIPSEWLSCAQAVASSSLCLSLRRVLRCSPCAVPMALRAVRAPKAVDMQGGPSTAEPASASAERSPRASGFPGYSHRGPRGGEHSPG